jgi:hypothetical protein
MRSLSASELLTVWERGVGRNSVEQALSLLAAASGEPWEELAALPIGERDARLFLLYEHLFGPNLEAFAECSRCGARLEYSLRVADLLPHAAAGPVSELLCEGRAIHLRLPDSADLLAIRKCGDESQGRRLLAERCADAALLTDRDVDAISTHLAQADPRAEVLVDLECPACGCAVRVMLAIEQFLWPKISWLAKRLLREVHVLARAYGWAEHDILSMSAVRRSRYLEWAEP